MKKSILFASLLSLSALAFSKNWGLSVKPYTGLTAGTLGEYLFSQYDKNLIVSDLQWEETLWNVGLKGEYNYKNFFVDAGFTYFMPFKCGKMYDSDYNSEFKMNLATFDNYSIFSYDIDVGMKYQFSLKDVFISPVFYAKYSIRDFHGKNGIGYFGYSDYSKTGLDVPWDSSDAQKYYCSDITYCRETIYTFAGLEIKIPVNKFTFSLTFLLSPFTYTNALDYHLDNLNQNRDFKIIGIQYSYFTRFMGSIQLSYKLTEKCSFNCIISGLIGLTDRGILVTNKGRTGTGYGLFEHQNQFYISKQDSGANIKEGNIKLFITYLF